MRVHAKHRLNPRAVIDGGNTSGDASTTSPIPNGIKPKIDPIVAHDLLQGDRGPRAGEPILDEERRDRVVRNAVLALPAKYRDVLTLFYFHGMDLARSAASLGVPQGTVKARLSRGNAHGRSPRGSSACSCGSRSSGREPGTRRRCLTSAWLEMIAPMATGWVAGGLVMTVAITVWSFRFVRFR